MKKTPNQFERFISEKIVNRVSIDKEKAKSLVYESERKRRILSQQVEKLGVNDENANDYLEYCYDTLMYLIRATLHLAGYKAVGQGAHEAEISYLRVLGFPETEVQFLNKMRDFRNRILYNGESFDAEYAEKVIAFTKRIYPRLKEIAKG